MFWLEALHFQTCPTLGAFWHPSRHLLASSAQRRGAALMGDVGPKPETLNQKP